MNAAEVMYGMVVGETRHGGARQRVALHAVTSPC